jgi:hypothetical protein
MTRALRPTVKHWASAFLLLWATQIVVPFFAQFI